MTSEGLNSGTAPTEGRLPSSLRYIAVQLAAKAGGALTLIVMARSTSPSTVGRYAAALLLASGASVVLDFGSSKSALRLRASGRTRRDVERAVGTKCNIARAVVAVGLVACFGPWDNFRLWIVAVAVGGVLALNGIVEAVLLGEGHGATAGIGNLTFNSVTLLLSLLAIVQLGKRTSADLLLMLYGAGAVSAHIFYAAADWRGARLESPRVTGMRRRIDYGDNSTISIVEEKRFALVSCSLMMLALIYFRCDLLALTAVATAAAIGQYAVGYRVFETALSFIQLIGYARQAKVAGTWAGSNRVEIHAQTVAGMVGVGIFLSGATLAGGPWVTRMLFGEAFGPSGRIAMLLSLGLVGQSLSLSVNTYLFGSTDVSAGARSTIAANMMCACVMIIGIVVGYSIGGVGGVAGGEAAVEMIVGLCWARFVFSKLGLPRKAALSALFCTLLGALGVISMTKEVVGVLIGGVIVGFAALMALVHRSQLIDAARNW